MTTRTRYHSSDAALIAAKRSERSYAVAIYSTGRSYGGPEEGGWYFTYGELDRIAQWFANEHDAGEFCRGFNQHATENRSTREARVIQVPRVEPSEDTNTCHDEPDTFEYVVRTDIPEFFPEGGPHYC